MKPLAVDLDKAAETIGVKRRFLADWLRANPWDRSGQPFYSARAGKTKLFTDNDIARIFAALPKPEAQPCPSSSARRTRSTPRGASAAPTSESKLTEALALARRLARKNSFSDGRTRSNVIAMPQPAPPPKD